MYLHKLHFSFRRSFRKYFKIWIGEKWSLWRTYH